MVGIWTILNLDFFDEEQLCDFQSWCLQKREEGKDTREKRMPSHFES